MKHLPALFITFVLVVFLILVFDTSIFKVVPREKIPYSEKDLECLARNIYFESGSEPIDGKYAVAQVTINRLKDGKWGSTICSVVLSPHQFSWTLNPSMKPDKNSKAWSESYVVAYSFLETGMRYSELDSALYFHSNQVDPLWKRKVEFIKQIGNHLFYKLRS